MVLSSDIGYPSLQKILTSFISTTIYIQRKERRKRGMRVGVWDAFGAALYTVLEERRSSVRRARPRITGEGRKASCPQGLSVTD